MPLSNNFSRSLQLFLLTGYNFICYAEITPAANGSPVQVMERQMATEVNFEWNWTGYVAGAFIGEPDISVAADVHRDGEVFVTGVALIETALAKNAQGKLVRVNKQNVQLDGSDDAFSLALFAKIKADLEIEQSFIKRAIEESGDDADSTRARRSPADYYGAPSRL